MRDEILFVVVPRLAALCCLSALVMTYFGRSGTSDRQESVLADSKFGQGLARWWRYSIGLVLVGHLVGLAFPGAVMLWDRQLARLVLLECLGVTAGSVALLSLLLIPIGRSRSSRSPFDIIAATLVLLEVGSGLAVAVRYRWASSWAEVTLTPYLHSLLGLKPSVVLVAHMPFLVQLHVFCAFTILAIGPLTTTAGFLIKSTGSRMRRTSAAG
jgi:nitrate reductase gamma subunit